MQLQVSSAQSERGCSSGRNNAVVGRGVACVGDLVASSTTMSGAGGPACRLFYLAWSETESDKGQGLGHEQASSQGQGSESNQGHRLGHRQRLVQGQ